MTMSPSRPGAMDDDRPIIDNGISPIERNGRSKNIPLPLSHKHRTESEMQLSEDMESAEQRDLNMFYRLVNGIRDRQMTLVRENESSTAAAAFYNPAHGLTEAERSLAHIIHTRNTPVEKSNFPTASFRINTARRNNYVASNPLHQQCQQSEKLDHENEWFVGGYDSSSNLSSTEQQHRQQQNASTNYDFSTTLNAAIGATNSVTPSLSTAPSSNEIAEEGMFDLEL